jgi:hypothetical protein
MQNRIINAIERMRKQIDSRVAQGLTTAEAVENARKSLDLDWSEFSTFQTHKSLAATNGKLTLEEAQTVYCYLGETPEHFNGQDAGVKTVLTQVFSELLGAAIGAR